LTSQPEVADIISMIKKAVSASLNESVDKVSIELKEFSKVGQIFNITATFKVAPFFVTRTGKVFVTMQQSEKELEITALRIDEDKGL
jgi:hypothetical protein